MDKEPYLLLEKFVPAIIALSGVIIGSILNHFLNGRLSKKNTKLRIIDKLIDKRINSYEEVLEISKIMRIVISDQKIDRENNLITFPKILLNKKQFDSFHQTFCDITNKTSHWISNKVYRELNYIQDYIASLTLHLKSAKDMDYPKIGELLKQDFISMSSTLEELTLEQYQNKILSLKIKHKKMWHKYKKEQTTKRLNETILIKNEEAIKNILN